MRVVLATGERLRIRLPPRLRIHQRSYSKGGSDERVVLLHQILRVSPRSVAPLGAAQTLEHAVTHIHLQQTKCPSAGCGVVKSQAARPSLITLTGKSGHMHIALVSG